MNINRLCLQRIIYFAGGKTTRNMLCLSKTFKSRVLDVIMPIMGQLYPLAAAPSEIFLGCMHLYKLHKLADCMSNACRARQKPDIDFLLAHIHACHIGQILYEKIIKFAEEYEDSCTVDAFCASNYWDKVYKIDKKYVSRYVEKKHYITRHTQARF